MNYAILVYECKACENCKIIKIMHYKDESTLISVIIPTYNGQDTLYNTINSALQQTYSNIEIIVVDDGSDISPKTIISRFSDNRICLYRIEHSNANVARNYGIIKSKGEYIAMLDADDQWTDKHLEDCLHLLKQTSADGVYGSLILSYDNSSIKNIGHHQIFYARGLKENESMMDYLLTTVLGAQTSSLFTTSESAKDILWDPDLIDHQDYDFVVRFDKKYKWMPKIEPTVFYYRSSGRSSHFESCIRFVENNIVDVNPIIYNSYNLRMMLDAINIKAPVSIINYFRKEATKYKECISYQLYISIKEPKNVFREWIEKITYLLYIMNLKIKHEKK